MLGNIHFRNFKQLSPLQWKVVMFHSMIDSTMVFNFSNASRLTRSLSPLAENQANHVLQLPQHCKASSHKLAWAGADEWKLSRFVSGSLQCLSSRYLGIARSLFYKCRQNWRGWTPAEATLGAVVRDDNEGLLYALRDRNSFRTPFRHGIFGSTILSIVHTMLTGWEWSADSEA